MNFSERITNLITLTEKYYHLNNFNDLNQEIRKFSEISSDIGVDLEIVFRQTMDTLLKQNNMILDKTTIIKFLQFSIQIGLECSSLSPNFPKIPFLLIEDLLESQTLKHAPFIWEIVESMVDTLTQPELFNRGKFVILRTCNSLLRRLSKSCHTEFCGRVLMFLAAIYPLSERSAVNLMGKVNTGNITGYEEQSTFDSIGGLENDIDQETNFVDDQMELEGNEEEKLQPNKNKVKTDSLSNSKTRDYALYKTFWNIQSSLASDPKTLDSKNAWPTILTDIETIISTFEADSFRKSEITSAKSRREAAILSSISTDLQERLTAAITSSSQHQYMGCKYLTSSQLFALELKDPAIRQQICTQLLILLHHRIRTPTPPPPANIVTTKKTSNVVEPSIFPSIDELKSLQTRIFTLIESTPPGGEDLANTLRTLFCEGREDYWMKWKQDHCPSFEKTNVEDIKVNKTSLPKKRKLSNLSSNSKREEKYYFEHSLETTQKNVQNLTSNVPTFEKHIIDFLDAEDPDAGIEDEYHPKHDSVYCWRARRLMANHRLSLFENMGDGNIAKGLEVLYPKNLSIKQDDDLNSNNDNQDTQSNNNHLNNNNTNTNNNSNNNLEDIKEDNFGNQSNDNHQNNNDIINDEIQVKELGEVEGHEVVE